MERNNFFESMEIDTQQEAIAIVEHIADLMGKESDRDPNLLISLCIQVADEVGAQPRFQLIECECGQWEMQNDDTMDCSLCQEEEEVE